KGAHEYLGELYLQMYDPASAQKELATLASLCPDGCDERDTLAKAIAAYQPPATGAAPAAAPAPATSNSRLGRRLLLLERTPHTLGSRRHVDMQHAERVGDRAHHRGQRADRAGLAAALGAERIGDAEHLLVLEIDVGHVGGARHRVVLEARGQELARAFVIDDVL